MEGHKPFTALGLDPEFAWQEELLESQQRWRLFNLNKSTDW
jgi:hypothetical protein